MGYGWVMLGSEGNGLNRMSASERGVGRFCGVRWCMVKVVG